MSQRGAGQEAGDGRCANCASRYDLAATVGLADRMVEDFGGDMTITDARAMNVEAAIHSAEIEGLQVTRETRTDADSYIAGTIDSNELVDRVRARYGLS